MGDSSKDVPWIDTLRELPNKYQYIMLNVACHHSLHDVNNCMLGIIRYCENVTCSTEMKLTA